MADVAIDAGGDVVAKVFTSTFTLWTMIATVVVGGLILIGKTIYSFITHPKHRDNALISTILSAFYIGAWITFSLVIYMGGSIYSNGTVETLFWWYIVFAIGLPFAHLAATRHAGAYTDSLTGGHPMDGTAHPIPAMSWIGAITLSLSFVCQAFAMWSDTVGVPLTFGLGALGFGVLYIGVMIATWRRLAAFMDANKTKIPAHALKLYGWMIWMLLVFFGIIVVISILMAFAPGVTAIIPDPQNFAIGLLVMELVMMVYLLINYLMFDIKPDPVTGNRPSFNGSGAIQYGRPLMQAYGMQQRPTNAAPAPYVPRTAMPMPSTMVNRGLPQQQQQQQQLYNSGYSH